MDSDMPESLSSILECLLLQAIPSSIVNPIFVFLPISPPFPPRLLKSLLLRPLILQSPFSPQTLTSFELIEQLDREQFSRPPSEALQLAYSAVAVDLTVRFLRSNAGGEGDLGDFFVAVNWVWDVRIGDLEEGEGKGLVSERLMEERSLMVRAVADGEARGVLRKRDTGREAMEAVGAYVREAVMELEPAVLETKAKEAVRRWRVGGQLGGRTEVRMLPGQNKATTGGDFLMSVCTHLNLPNIIQEKNQLKPGDEKDCTMIEEPLPETLQAAAGISTVGTGHVPNHESTEENQRLMDCDQAPSVDKGAEVSPAMDIGSGLPKRVHETFLQPSNANQNLSELNNGEENQNAVSGNAVASSTGGDSLMSVCIHLPLPNIIQEKNQLKPGDEKDCTMVEEPLPEILQAAAGISTVGAGDVSNHERMKRKQSLMDCDQAPSVDKGAEVSPAVDISSSLPNRVHNTFLQPSNVDQNLSELNNRKENQNAVSGNAMVSSSDKGTVTLSTAGKSTLIGKKRGGVDDIGLQAGLVNQNTTEWENGEENQNAMRGNAMASSLDKGMVAPSTEGKSTLIGKKGDGVYDTGLQPSLMDRSPTQRENERENHNVVRADATSYDKSTIAIHADGTSTLIGKKDDGRMLRKPSIMDRKPTARTHKWHDDSVSSTEASPNPSEKRQIRRPKRTGVPDMESPWNREFAGRRNKKWWSPDEEDTLRKAVEKFGVGNWTLIKNSYPAIFEDRTSGDLKDKWRNMIK